MPDLDIVIPVYNEGENIVGVLEALSQSVRASFRVLICYDHEDDNTLEALKHCGDPALEVVPVKNTGSGAHAAVLSGFRASDAESVIVTPADDTSNAGIIDEMVRRFKDGADLVVASRYSPGGGVENWNAVRKFGSRLATVATRSFLRGAKATPDPLSGFFLFRSPVIHRVQLRPIGYKILLEILTRGHTGRVASVPYVFTERAHGGSKFGWREQINFSRHLLRLALFERVGPTSRRPKG